MSKKLLTKKRQTWAGNRGGAQFKGAPLNPNVSAQAKYAAQLEKLVAQMTKETRREVLAVFNAHGYAQDASLASMARIAMNYLMAKFQKLFGQKAKTLAESMVEKQSKLSALGVSASLKEASGGLKISGDVFGSRINDIMKASVAENVGLIKSIPTDYLNQVQGDVMRSITTGNGLQDLVPALEKYEGVTKRRAKNIALDQTRKVYNSLNAGRMQALGIKKFEWIHSGGGQKPRQDHIEMSGNIYSFNDLPVIDKRTGERGIPGQAINCRCRMAPVIEFGDDENAE